jgi:TRAP-type mannitol/chloroaromatic compound transport system permease large subunit
VLTLLILQTSFLVPPFGYAVLMARGRLRSPVGMKELARALLPYVAAQVCVLALVIAFPRILWRDESYEPVSSPPAVSDEVARDLLDKQLSPQSR